MNKPISEIGKSSVKRIKDLVRESKRIGERFEALEPEEQLYLLGAISTLETMRNVGRNGNAPPGKKGA